MTLVDCLCCQENQLVDHLLGSCFTSLRAIKIPMCRGFLNTTLVEQLWFLAIIVELRTPAMPIGVGGGKERGGFHLNLRT